MANRSTHATPRWWDAAVRAVLAVALVAAVATVGTPASASASDGPSAAPLSCTAGVIVVIDFSALGGQITESCDTAVQPGRSSGLQVLQSSGFSVQGTLQYGLAFPCRINGEPADQSCDVTPPANAYWAYWHALPGQDSWSYSTSGAESYCPALGSVEGWAFGAGVQPATPPSAVRAVTGTPPASPPSCSGASSAAPPSPTTVATTAPAPVTTRASAPASPATVLTAPPVTVASHASQAAPPAAPTTTVRPGAAPTSVAATSTTVIPVSTTTQVAAPPGGAPAGPGAAPRGAPAVPIVDASAAAHHAPAAGSATAALAGGALVAAVAAGAGLTALRRRRPRPGGE